MAGDFKVQATEKFPVACFAPEMTDELLSRYRAMIDALPQDGYLCWAMNYCYVCVAEWWNLPESTRTDGQAFVVGTTKTNSRGKSRPAKKTVTIVPLEEEHVEALWPMTPWESELLAINENLAALPDGTHEITVEEEITGRDGKPAKVTVQRVVLDDEAAHSLKAAAKHLLWFAMEIAKDREPLTAERAGIPIPPSRLIRPERPQGEKVEA